MPLIILGTGVVKKLFETWEEPLGEEVLLGGSRYVVVGVTESRGKLYRLGCHRITSV